MDARTFTGRTAFAAWVRQGILCLAVLAFVLSFPVAALLHEAEAAGTSAAEARIIKFVKEIYGGGDSVRVRLNVLPQQLGEKAKIVNLSFARVPDANGDGICAVEVEAAPGRTRTVQIPFKVYAKRELFVLKEAAQKGYIISANDIAVRETYMTGKGAGYPAGIDDVVGKALKRDVAGNTVITDQVLEDRIAIKRGDIVTIIAETNKLVVQARGRTIDKGRVGDMIRVKNIASGKELTARVVSSTAVKVEF